MKMGSIAADLDYVFKVFAAAVEITCLDHQKIEMKKLLRFRLWIPLRLPFIRLPCLPSSHSINLALGPTHRVYLLPFHPCAFRPCRSKQMLIWTIHQVPILETFTWTNLQDWNPDWTVVGRLFQCRTYRSVYVLSHQIMLHRPVQLFWKRRSLQVPYFCRGALWEPVCGMLF